MKTFKELCADFFAIKVSDYFDIEDSKMTYKEKLAAYAENDKKKMERTIVQHNAEVVFLDEYLPAILDVYNKYAGKRVGEKTTEKIRNSLHELLGEMCHAYIDNDGIHYSILNGAWKCVYFSYDQKAQKRNSKWDKDGKLNNLVMAMFHTNVGEYIESLEEYINTKREQAERIKQLSNELENARKEYDDNLCDGFVTLDYGKTNTSFSFRM